MQQVEYSQILLPEKNLLLFLIRRAISFSRCRILAN